MSDQNIKDKAVFIAALLAVFLTLTTFKDQLSKVTVPVGHQTFTIWGLTVFLISLLMISVYFYALSYIRYSFGKYQDNKIVKIIFRIFIFIANFFYTVALVFPLLAIISSLVETSPLGTFSRNHSLALGIFDAVGAVVILVLAGLNAYFSDKKIRHETGEKGA